ncbi:MAG: tetratricopeptide repeat protein [Bryobacteraceae bacterium]
MKSGLIVLVCVSAMAQVFSRRDTEQPWLEGKFADAEQNFARMHGVGGWSLPYVFVYEAEYEIERARYGHAAALLEDAKRSGLWGSHELPERWQARLLLTVGRFAEAEKAALEGHRWDGRDVKKLKVEWVTDLVTLGEIALARGNCATAASILERARDWAKETSKLDRIRAIDDIAAVDLALGSVQAASEVATSALSAAEREWGTASIPAMDSLDTFGLVQISQGAFQDARDSLLRSRKWREELYGTNHPKVADSYIHCALFCAAQGQRDDAVRLLERGLQIQKANSAGPNGRWALALLVGAEIYVKAGRTDEATECYTSAIPILERELGPDAPRLKDARMRYDELRNR